MVQNWRKILSWIQSLVFCDPVFVPFLKKISNEYHNFLTWYLRVEIFISQESWSSNLKSFRMVIVNPFTVAFCDVSLGPFSETDENLANRMKRVIRDSHKSLRIENIHVIISQTMFNLSTRPPGFRVRVRTPMFYRWVVKTAFQPVVCSGKA